MSDEVPDGSRYYDEHAAAFSERTAPLDLESIRRPFAARLAPGASILDLGCGSGRDTRAFRDAGFDVLAIDGSPRLCALARDLAGDPVLCGDFMTLDLGRTFAGVWACASLVHLEPDAMVRALDRIHDHLDPAGIAFLSIKAPAGPPSSREGAEWVLDRGDRRFVLYDEKRFRVVLASTSGLESLQIHQGAGRSDPAQSWLEVLLRRADA